MFGVKNPFSATKIALLIMRMWHRNTATKKLELSSIMFLTKKERKG